MDSRRLRLATPMKGPRLDIDSSSPPPSPDEEEAPRPMTRLLTLGSVPALPASAGSLVGLGSLPSPYSASDLTNWMNVGSLTLMVRHSPLVESGSRAALARSTCT